MKKLIIIFFFYKIKNQGEDLVADSLEEFYLEPKTYDGNPESDIYEKNLLIMKPFARLQKILPFKIQLKMFKISKKKIEKKLKELLKKLETNNTSGYKIYLGDKWYNDFMISKFRDDFFRSYLVIPKRSAQELYDIDQKRIKDEKENKLKQEKEMPEHEKIQKPDTPNLPRGLSNKIDIREYI